MLATNVSMIAVFPKKSNEKRGVSMKIFADRVNFFSITLANCLAIG